MDNLIKKLSGTSIGDEIKKLPAIAQPAMSELDDDYNTLLASLKLDLKKVTVITDSVGVEYDSLMLQFSCGSINTLYINLLKQTCDDVQTTIALLYMVIVSLAVMMVILEWLKRLLRPAKFQEDDEFDDKGDSGHNAYGCETDETAFDKNDTLDRNDTMGSRNSGYDGKR